MSGKVKYIASLFFILLILSLSCKDESSNKVISKNGDNPVTWDKIPNGLNNARAQKKPVLIFFYTEWCIYCKKMNTEVFNDPEVSQYINENFICMRINPEKDTENIEIMGEKIAPANLMSYTGSNGFPTTLFLDNKSRPVTTIPGFIEKKAFLSILKYLKQECYKGKISIDDYIKNPDLCSAEKKDLSQEKISSVK